MELERCGFLHFEVYLVSDNFSCFYFFNSEILRSICELFSIFFRNFQKIFLYLKFFSEMD